MSNYIVIDSLGGAEHAHIQLNEDGTNKVFTTFEDANREAEQCHNGIIVLI